MAALLRWGFLILIVAAFPTQIAALQWRASQIGSNALVVASLKVKSGVFRTESPGSLPFHRDAPAGISKDLRLVCEAKSKVGWCVGSAMITGRET